jgi:hypothetical protein
MKLRCLNCHDFGSALAREGLSKATAVLGRLLPQSGTEGRVETGCLLAKSENRTAPEFQLTPAERSALGQAVAAGNRLQYRPSDADDAERLFASLRCAACHQRDEQSAILPQAIGEEGRFGIAPEAIPNLTWAGDRLQASWMEKFIAGQISYRPRPALQLRMPAFPLYAKTLAAGFAAQHGSRHSELAHSRPAVASPGEEDELAIGFRLTMKEGGMDCRQCHGVGHQEPPSDQRTRIAPGINFMHVRDRLRYDFYRRFVLDPPRYDGNTRMPKLSDGAKTPLTQFWDGNAPRQFDAIWQYVQTLGEDEP